MAIISGLMAGCAGLVHPKMPFHIKKYSRSMSTNCSAVQLVTKSVPRGYIHFSLFAGRPTRYAVATSAGNHHELSYNNDFVEEPFWMKLLKEVSRALKSLFNFLLEQPSQLKYIEWPSFQSTLKTAYFTLLLVALLIVALATVDSALGYLLALLLRKTP